MRLTLIILKYSLLLLAAHLVLSWVFQFSHWNVPQNIPYTPIKINGLLIVGFTVAVLNFSQKEIIKADPEIQILKLTLLGLGICLIADVIFQFILSFTNEVDKLYYFFHAIVVLAIFNSALSFFVAFQLKTKQTKQLLLFIAAFIIAFRIVLYLFPNIMKA
jgi:hypothetical protein